MQVQVVDQTTHPPKCHSFVGLDRQIGSSPPAAQRKTKAKTKTKTVRKDPCDSKGYTHTRLPEGRRKAKVRANVHVCTHTRQKNEDMTGGRDGTKVRVVEMKGNQVHRDTR